MPETPFVVLGHHLRQPLQQVHQDRCPGVARIAARHEHVVQARHAGKDLVPEFALAFDLSLVRVVRLHDWEPDPDIHVQLVADAGLDPEHVQVGNREVGAVVQIVRARWNDLDGIGTEQRQVEDVAPELRLVPGAVGVGLVPIAQLVADQRVIRHGIGGDGVRPGPARLGHVHLAQHAPDAKQHGARTVAQDADGLPVTRAGGPNPVRILGLGAQVQFRVAPQPVQMARVLGGAQHEAGCTGRWTVDHGQVPAGAGRDFVGQDPGTARHPLRWFVRCGDKTKVVEVSHWIT